MEENIDLIISALAQCLVAAARGVDSFACVRYTNKEIPTEVAA